MRFWIAMTGLLASLAAGSVTAEPVLVHEERSLYRNIQVTDADGIRCLRFSYRGTAGHNQSCIHLDPAKASQMVFDYTRMALVGLLLREPPKRVLVIGLGGGIIPKALVEAVPGVTVDAVEIDPAIGRVATRFFGFPDRPDLKVHYDDGRVFLKRALRAGARYDWIVLDAFNGDYIPEHLMTIEFLREVKSALSPSGLVVSNTINWSKLYDHEGATYEHAFPAVAQLKIARGTRLMVASTTPIVWPKASDPAATRWGQVLARLGTTPSKLLAMRTPNDWDNQAAVLTDQYSPANLLKHQER